MRAPRYMAIIEGFNHSLEWVPRDYKEITLLWQWKEQAQTARKSNTYQRKNIFIYYCVFIIPIPILIYIHMLCRLESFSLVDLWYVPLRRIFIG